MENIFVMQRKLRQIFLFIVLFVVMIFMYLPVAAQNLPSITYGTIEQIGPGTTWQTASSPDPRWEIHIIRIDLSNRNILLRPDHREREEAFFRTSVLAREADAIAAVNGSFFGLASDSPYFGQSIEYCVINGEMVSPNRQSGPRPTFGLSHDRDRRSTHITTSNEPSPPDPDWDTIIHALAGAPFLVAGGSSVAGLDNATRHPRTIMGWNDSDKVVTLVTIDGRQPGWSVGMTLQELAWLLLDLGCENGINYDGGGSTTAWVLGEVVNQGSDGHERGTVTAWLVIPAYVIDHTDVECTVEGTWNTSTFSGYYNADSLTASGGDPSQTVTWRPDLEQRGRYKVYAWYVDGSNRTPTASYTINAYNGTHQVTVDQRSGGKQWHMLGTYSFEEGTQGAVTLTNTASPGEIISADAVKFVYLDQALDEVIIDNVDTPNVEIVGAWGTGSWHTPYGENYHHTDSDAGGTKSFHWFTETLTSGEYEVYAYWVAGSNRNTNTQYIINHSGGQSTVYKDQTQDSMRWNKLGTYTFHEGEEARITLTNLGSGVVIADAVRFLLMDPLEPDKTAAPQFAPAPGTYGTPQNVTISCATPGAEIHYTTDGSDPITSGTVQSGNPGATVTVHVPMNTTMQIQAYATHGDYADSSVTIGTYTVQRTLSSLGIEGPSELALNTSIQYHARAYYNDGSNSIVPAEWSLHFPDTEELFSEDFTGYANQAAFEAAWRAHASGSLQMSTAQARSTRSAMQDHTQRANYYALGDSYQGTNANPLVFEFWMYDSNAGLTNARHFISLASYSGGDWGAGTLQNLVALGIYNSPDAATKYKARTLYGDNNWVATSIDRSTGWRKMTIRLLASTVEYYVDGSLAYQGPYTVPATGWNAIRMGSELTSTQIFNVYYDDLIIYREISSQDPPAQISSGGLVTTGQFTGQGSLHASYTENSLTREDSLNITISEETRIDDWFFY